MHHERISHGSFTRNTAGVLPNLMYGTGQFVPVSMMYEVVGSAWTPILTPILAAGAEKVDASMLIHTMASLLKSIALATPSAEVFPLEDGTVEFLNSQSTVDQLLSDSAIQSIFKSADIGDAEKKKIVTDFIGYMMRELVFKSVDLSTFFTTSALDTKTFSEGKIEKDLSEISIQGFASLMNDLASIHTDVLESKAASIVSQRLARVVENNPILRHALRMTELSSGSMTNNHDLGRVMETTGVNSLFRKKNGIVGLTVPVWRVDNHKYFFGLAGSGSPTDPDYDISVDTAALTAQAEADVLTRAGKRRAANAAARKAQTQADAPFTGKAETKEKEGAVISPFSVQPTNRFVALRKNRIYRRWLLRNKLRWDVRDAFAALAVVESVLTGVDLSSVSSVVGDPNSTIAAIEREITETLSPFHFSAVPAGADMDVANALCLQLVVYFMTVRCHKRETGIFASTIKNLQPWQKSYPREVTIFGEMVKMLDVCDHFYSGLLDTYAWLRKFVDFSTAYLGDREDKGPINPHLIYITKQALDMRELRLNAVAAVPSDNQRYFRSTAVIRTHSLPSYFPFADPYAMILPAPTTIPATQTAVYVVSEVRGRLMSEPVRTGAMLRHTLQTAPGCGVDRGKMLNISYWALPSNGEPPAPLFLLERPRPSLGTMEIGFDAFVLDRLVEYAYEKNGDVVSEPERVLLRHFLMNGWVPSFFRDVDELIKTYAVPSAYRKVLEGRVSAENTIASLADHISGLGLSDTLAQHVRKILAMGNLTRVAIVRIPSMYELPEGICAWEYSFQTASATTNGQHLFAYSAAPFSTSLTLSVGSDNVGELIPAVRDMLSEEMEKMILLNAYSLYIGAAQLIAHLPPTQFASIPDIIKNFAYLDAKDSLPDLTYYDPKKHDSAIAAGGVLKESVSKVEKSNASDEEIQDSLQQKYSEEKEEASNAAFREEGSRGSRGGQPGGSDRGSKKNPFSSGRSSFSGGGKGGSSPSGGGKNRGGSNSSSSDKSGGPRRR